MPPSDDPIPPYDHGVAEFAAKFEILSPESIWAHVRDLIPAKPGAIVLDIGAGSGRDAAWLASLGMTATAAGPADADQVSVPLGLVALNWIRAYLPLVSASLPQMPGNAGPDGLGFAQAGSEPCWPSA